VASSSIKCTRPDEHPQVLLITIDRPPVNAMSLAAHRELLAALRSVEDDPQIRCVVLTGAGDRSFVAGGDVGELGALDPASALTRTRVIRQVSADQPVERAATLADVRASVLAPDRINAFVISGFAGVALLIAVVGVAGVLAFTVRARTRELGVRLALGSSPRQLLVRVLMEGAAIVAIGIVAGAAGGYAFAQVAGRVVENVHLPGALPLLGAAAVLVGAGVLASLMPAARAAHVDVLRALRAE